MFGGTTKKLAIAAAAALAGITAASAAEASMTTGLRTSQPVGHYEFCRIAPQECSQRGAKPAAQPMTKALWNTINRVNKTVNAAHAPRTDYQMWGQEEVWSYPAAAADCEDYALEKRRKLMALGIPAGNLLITVLRQPNGDGHAVLTVRTTRGDYILDNLDGRVLPWQNTPYTYLKRQSERDSGVWLSITDGRDAPVASVR